MRAIVLQGDSFGARGFALAVIRARAEKLAVHLGDHLQRTRIALGLSLGKEAEVTDLRRDE
jgi:hypothetical protein